MKRLKNIDILKAIGLLCIILAHVETKGLFFQLRNFDVVLMIMLSSYLYMIKNNIETDINLKYFEKRVKRLVLPTWIFLALFFILSQIFIKYDLKTVISTFLLHNGIGYVWIIRIYLITAIVLPIIVPLLKEKGNIVYIYIGILYFLYELLAEIKIFNTNIFMNDIVAYIIPVTLIITVSYWIMNNNNRRIMTFAIINFTIFIVNLIVIYKLTGKIQNTNYMKYPFRIYYLSYAFFVSSILIVIFRNDKLNDLIYNNIIEFISRSSLWIYLHHIFFVVLFNNLYPDLNKVIKYFCILFLAIGITYVQNKLIDILEKKGINKEKLNVFRG